MNRKRQAQPTPIPKADGPAKAGPGQVLVDEPIAHGSGHGQVKRTRNIGEHQLTLAKARGKITDRQYDAGMVYRALHDLKFRSGRDSTDLDVVSGGGSSTPYTQRQADAMRDLGDIHARLSLTDGKIVENFCGKDYEMTEAVMRITGCHPSGVIYRLREAVDSLVAVLPTIRLRSRP